MGNAKPLFGPRREVFITGSGCASALGMNKVEILRSLQAGEDGSREVSLFSTEGCRCRRAAGFPEPEGRAAKALFPESADWHRISRILLLTALEAMDEHGGNFTPELAAFGTTSGGMSFGEEFYRAWKAGTPARNFRRKVSEYTPQQAGANVLAARHWNLAPVIISNACASGTNAIGHAWQMVASGLADSAICGGYDVLSELVFAGFESLRAMTPDLCRPFDRDRSGLLLGEGAGILLLESESSMKKSGGKPLARILGYGTASDNHHLTQPNPDGSGPLSSMRQALDSADLVPNQIDYLNAHGTATPFNDACEGRAIMELFPEVPVSSTKGMSGHALGAAGAIEAVFCLIALENGFCPPNANLLSPDPEFALRLVQNTKDFPGARIAMSNSLGFGGSNASLILGVSAQ